MNANVALTSKVKDELLGVAPTGTDTRIAEATAMLRVASEFEQGLRGLEIRAEFVERAVAEHLASTIRDVCDIDVEVKSINAGTQSR